MYKLQIVFEKINKYRLINNESNNINNNNIIFLYVIT